MGMISIISMERPSSLMNESYPKSKSIFYANIARYYVGNNAKGRIAKRVFQERKACQNFRKNKHFLPPDAHTCMCITSYGITVIVYCLPRYHKFSQFKT